MQRNTTLLYDMAAALAAGAIITWILWRWAGPTADGGGYSPGLTIPGLTVHSASLHVYDSEPQVRLQYFLPYVVHGLIFSLLTTKLTWSFVRIFFRAEPRIAVFGCAVSSLLLIWSALDSGNALDLWDTPRWLGLPLSIEGSLRTLLTFGIPIGVLSTALYEIRHRVGHWAR
jgi:hypothetical protein